MRQIMLRALLFVSGTIIVLIILLLSLLICKRNQNNTSTLSPLERGLATTRQIYSVLSVQILFILILFLILDLEVVFIIRFILRGNICTLKRLAFISFITITL